jgi:transcriptional regulator with XRE-family HTH domain
MERKKFQRLTRPTRLTPEEVARNQDLRQKIEQEFPPAKPCPPKAGSISDALRAAIQASPRSVYQICKDSGISQIVVSRFLSGERDIRLTTADRLATALGLAVATGHDKAR